MKKCICAIIKNEHRFFKEWVLHHLELGFDDIYVFEDYDSDSHKGIVEDERVHIANLRDFNIPQIKNFRQHNLYHWFLNTCKDKADWCAFIDADEFFMLEEGYTLEKLCEEFEPYAGILLYWKTFGANGHIKRPETPLITTYTRQSTEFQRRNGWDFKSFVNMHRAWKWDNIHKVNGGINTEFGKVSKMVGTTPKYGKAWINHYQTKSWEDWVDRLKLGAFSFNYRTADTFFQINPELSHRKKELINEIKNEKFPSLTVLSPSLGIYIGGNLGFINSLNKRSHQ